MLFFCETLPFRKLSQPISRGTSRPHHVATKDVITSFRIGAVRSEVRSVCNCVRAAILAQMEDSCLH
eukprot:3267789-Ditylum_brightwellii.AAC.1